MVHRFLIIDLSGKKTKKKKCKTLTNQKNNQNVSPSQNLIKNLTNEEKKSGKKNQLKCNISRPSLYFSNDDVEMLRKSI